MIYMRIIELNRFTGYICEVLRITWNLSVLPLFTLSFLVICRCILCLFQFTADSKIFLIELFNMNGRGHSQELGIWIVFKEYSDVCWQTEAERFQKFILPKSQNRSKKIYPKLNHWTILGSINKFRFFSSLVIWMRTNFQISFTTEKNWKSFILQCGIEVSQLKYFRQ